MRTTSVTLTEAQLEAVVSRLEGQCVLSLEQVLEEMGLEGMENDADVCTQVDDRVFCCEGCDWWCLAEELNNDGDENLCDECNDED